MRIHKFGELDKDGGEGSDAGKGPSFKAMAAWAKDLPEVKKEILMELEASRRLEPEGAQGAELPDWKKRLELDGNGAAKKNAWNLKLIFRNDKAVAKKFAYNQFDSKIYVRDDEKGTLAPIRNVSAAQIREHLDISYGLDAKDKIKDALLIAAEENAFHPIREYLDELRWDGMPRIHQVLRDVFGVPMTPYSTQILKCWMTAAVARVYQPGTKFDEMLVAVGEQGTGKSTFFKKLAVNWFSDSFLGVEGTRAMEQLRGAWIMEIAELAGFRKSDIESVKHFVSKTVDTYRGAYTELPEDFPRQVVFAATTNELTFLLDAQNRRYWPFRLNMAEATLSVFSVEFDKLIPKLWAEAVENYRSGGTLLLTKAAHEEAEEERREYMVSDERTGVIFNFLDKRLPKDWSTRSRSERIIWLGQNDENSEETGLEERRYVATIEIWCECLGKEKEDASRRNLMEINSIMRKAEGWREGKGLRGFGEYGRQRYYERIETE